MKNTKNSRRRVKTTTKYRIHLWSDSLGKHAPSVHPLRDTPEAARTLAAEVLKMPENLAGNRAFKIEPEKVAVG